MKNKHSVGEKIKVLRRKKCWPQSQLAEITGLSERTIQRIENNEVASMESLKAIASAFDISVDDLTKTKEQKNKKLDFLIRVTTERELFELIEGSHAHQFHHDDPENSDEVEIIGEFLQNVKDYGDIWDDIEPQDKVRATFDANIWIKNLEDLGLWVFGGKFKKTCLTRMGPVDLNVLCISLYRSDDPKIISAENLKEAVSIMHDSHFTL